MLVFNVGTFASDAGTLAFDAGLFPFDAGTLALDAGTFAFLAARSPTTGGQWGLVQPCIDIILGLTMNGGERLNSGLAAFASVSKARQHKAMKSTGCAET